VQFQYGKSYDYNMRHDRHRIHIQVRQPMLRRVTRKIKHILFPPDPTASLVYGDLNAYRDLAADEYVEHLRFIIGGYLINGNVEAIECALRHMPDGGAIVEIGAFLGLSTNIIAYGAHKYGRKNPFFTCDPWKFAGSDKPKAGYFSTGTKDYRDWVTTIYKMNLRLFSPNFAPYTIEAFSDRFFELWAAKTHPRGSDGRPDQLRLH
jgi:hypothetical protein